MEGLEGLRRDAPSSCLGLQLMLLQMASPCAYRAVPKPPQAGVMPIRVEENRWLTQQAELDLRAAIARHN